MKFFPHAEGYVNYTQGSYNYVFNYTDHLGNVRLSYGLDSQTHVLTILEENNYYPFGLKHTNYNNTLILWQNNANNMPALLPVAFNSLVPSLYNYKYNGKELQNELGLGVYDYGARNYDPALGRWMNIDPLAEKMRRYSPYNYVFNNPMRFTDPDGMLPEDIIFLIRNDDGSVKEQFKYRNGNFYHENGKRYNPGKEGISKTMYNVLASYRTIMKSNDRTLKSQLHKLETSNQKHYIERSPNGENAVSTLDRDNSYFGKPASTQTEFDFDAETGKDVFQTVVHEMRHQFDHDIGNMQDNARGNDENDPAEIRAVYNENRANDILGKKHKTTYGGKEIDPNKLKNPPNNKQIKDVNK
ncbi:RHS repeat domain-containing protein [Flavobacterium sp. '19STA2R22 D10 B1']|uniref:RHS repeat domain-containing protein n=1 Tax=Flavobacterium aerium TaxID=3037261 RepID=UPI00278BED6F|nr:RHS repeat-associated core domain-containing protein [Flavobacterium sp. '19STA2R22 D10 B1']